MVFETLRCVFILTETFAFAVIIVVIDSAEPVTRALDAEMVTGVDRQLAFTGRGLQERLRHRNGSRDAVVFLLLHRGLFPFVDILQIRCILYLCLHHQSQS